MKKRIKISDYPNIKKQLTRIPAIIGMYFTGSFTLYFIRAAMKCLVEIWKYKIDGSKSGYNIEFSREFFNNFVIGAGIGIILFLWQIYRYSNIRTTRLGKTIWKSMEMKEDSYFKYELKRLDDELKQFCKKGIKTGEITLTERWLLGKGNFWMIDAVPIRQIQFIEAKLQHKIYFTKTGGSSYTSPALLVTLKNGDKKGFFISDIEYGNEIVEKVKRQISNETIQSVPFIV